MRRRRKIDPIVLLILHALSGCDTTSFIRGVTKKKIFSTYLNDPDTYSGLVSLISVPPPKESLVAAERLLVHSHSSRVKVNSLDELRASGKRFSESEWMLNMISSSIDLFSRYAAVSRTWAKKYRTNLPPSSNAFYHHCLRATRQIFIWALIVWTVHESTGNGNIWISSKWIGWSIRIKWTSLSNVPDDPRLMTCGQCSSGCVRCKCGIIISRCTFYCQCKPDACTNQSRIHVGYSMWTALFSLECFSPLDATNLGELPIDFVWWPTDWFDF